LQELCQRSCPINFDKTGIVTQSNLLARKSDEARRKTRPFPLRRGEPLFWPASVCCKR
jgi:hypothetical protein